MWPTCSTPDGSPIGRSGPTRPRTARETAGIERSIPSIHGDVAPGFEPVADEFRRNFVERGEVGAAVCALRHGDVVVDLWGGRTGPNGGPPWGGDTLVDVYSAGKAVVASLVLRALAPSGVRLDTPVVDVWPEFAAGGKSWVTIADALSHRAAVPAIRAPLTDDDLFDWSTMTAAVAETRPWWQPGARHAYHTNTFGHLAGELVRRMTGRMPGDVLREVAADLGADIWFGVPESEQARCADVIWAAPPRPVPDPEALTGDSLMNVLAHFNPPGYSSVGVVNTPAWRSAQVPSTNGHGSARGLARFYAGLLEDGRVVDHDVLAVATRPHSIGPCPILGEDAVFGIGFTPTTVRRPFGANPRSFGHYGTGGAVGFADPDAGIAFGYVMNHVIPRWQSTRNRALIDRLYDVLPAVH